MDLLEINPLPFVMILQPEIGYRFCKLILLITKVQKYTNNQSINHGLLYLQNART